MRKNPLEQLLSGAPAQRFREPVTARVVRSDSSGVWCVPLGGDTRHPIGPCRGAWRRVFSSVAGHGPEAPEPSHRHDELQRLPVGAVVLLVFTDAGPWVAAWDEGGA